MFGKVSIVFGVLLLLFAGVQVLLTFHFWSRSLDRSEQLVQWDSAAYLAAVMSTKANEPQSLGEFERQAFAFTRANGKSSIFLLDAEGKIAYRFFSNSAPIRESVSLEPIHRFLSAQGSNEAPILGEDPTSRERWSVFSVAPMTVRGKTMYLYIVFSNDAWRNASVMSYENAIGATILFWSGLSTFALIVLGLFLFQVLARRFARITKTVRKFHEGDFSSRIGLAADDELGVLGATIDEMAVRIERSIAELKERDTLRRELVANVSHDLRGPLNNIQGNLTLAHSQPNDASVAAQCLSAIERNSTYLSDLLSQLFELARLEAQEAKPDCEEFPVDEMLDDLRMSYSSRIDEQGIRLETQFSVRPLFVYGDIRMLDRVVMNLVENAVKFTPPGGQICIRAEDAGARVRVSVSDTGVGISEADLPRVLEKSFQGVEAPKGKGSGGLGLAIVDRLLRVHGSRVKIESELNRGTTFSFELSKTAPPSPK